MVFLGIAVIIISQSNGAKHEIESDDDDELISVMWPILFVALNACIHTSITVTGRYWMLKGNISSFDLNNDAFLWHCVISAIV